MTLAVVGTDPRRAGRAPRHRLPGQVVGVGALLALVAVLLRMGPSPEAAVAASRWSRVKRFLLTWLPLVIVLVVSVYLLLLWTYGFLVEMSATHLVWATVLTVGACVLGALVDANATSLHGFYRSRISDAFAVGVDDEEAPAAASDRPCRRARAGSRLPLLGAARTGPEDGPRLHVVATLNSRAANESPTMRGGFPLVFGPTTVEVHREEGRRVSVRPPPTRTSPDPDGSR